MRTTKSRDFGHRLNDIAVVRFDVRRLNMDRRDESPSIGGRIVAMLEDRTIVSAPMGEDDIVIRLEQPSEILGLLINVQMLSDVCTEFEITTCPQSSPLWFTM